MTKKWLQPWVHLELIEAGGWFKNLPWGKGPWLELAYIENQCFELNLGYSKGGGPNTPAITDQWQCKGKYLWLVPGAELPLLINWTDSFFSKASDGATDRRLMGWIIEL